MSGEYCDVCGRFVPIDADHVCEGPTPLPAVERQQFEAAMREAFVCSEHSFVQGHPWGYINTVMSQTFGGRVQPNYADVQMLWKTWQAARAILALRAPVEDDYWIRQHTAARLAEFDMRRQGEADQKLMEQALAVLEEIEQHDDQHIYTVLPAIAALRARLGGQTGSDGVNPSGKEQR